ELPKLHGVLVFAGILTEEYVVPEATAVGRIPYLERAVHWDRLAAAATNPVSLLPTVYGWGTAKFDWQSFLRAVGRLLGGFGVPAMLGAPGDMLKQYYADDAFDRQLVGELSMPVVSVLTDAGGAQLTLRVLPIPHSGTDGMPAGFVLYPEINGTLSTGAIALGAGVSVDVDAHVDDIPIRLDVRPTGADVIVNT